MFVSIHISFVNLGFHYIQTCLKQSLKVRFNNYMCIDWLSLEETRRFSDHVYTEPTWTRTIKGKLFNGQILKKFLKLCSVVPGLSHIRSCLEKSLITRFEKFMSIDWLPLEETRTFGDHVYTEPCWTRTIKGTLQGRKVHMNRLYDIFNIYQDRSRVLAEGNLVCD